MKILMATSLYHPAPGGSERQAHQLARCLIARGHEVRVLTMRLGPGPAVSSVEGVPVYRGIRAIQRGALFGLSYLLTSMRAMARFRRHAEIIHAHHLYLDAVTAAVMGPVLRVPTLAKVACGGAVGDLARLRRTAGGGILLRILRRLQRVVAPSRQTEAEVLTVGFARDRVVRIPNGVDIGRFAPAGRFQPASPARTVLFLGRLDAQKCVDVLLRAWGDVVAQLPETTLAICGDGPEASALRSLAVRAGIAGHVRFLGAVPDPDIRLRAAVAFVLPSRHEGLPNVLLEAMATGLPCVATAIAGTMDVATDECDALLVPPGDAAALTKALLRVLTDGDLADRLGSAARRRVAADFSLDTMVSRYEQLVAEMRDAA